MTWIEGVGDEVPIFIILAVVVVVIFMVLAWKSTDVPESSLTIPVLTFTITSRETPTTSGIVNSEEGPPSRPEETSSNQEIPLTLNPDLIASHQTSSVRNIVTNPETNEENNAETSPTVVEEENNLRRRCHSSSSTNSQIISVKLMYMDDTHRIVESPSNITLGDFKKTHFKNVLSSNKVVKLIFNGQVLSEESSTISQLGLDNNSVVHCLVHQPRTASSAPNSPNTSPGPSHYTTEDPVPRNTSQQNTADAGIDIGGLLVPLFGVILGLVWYCRIAYATHFTAAATTALVGLSGLCVFSFFIIWYPTAEQEN